MHKRKILAVCLHDWEGIYVDGKLVYEDNNLTDNDIADFMHGFKREDVYIKLIDVTTSNSLDFFVTKEGGFPISIKKLSEVLGIEESELQ